MPFELGWGTSIYLALKKEEGKKENLGDLELRIHWIHNFYW